MNRRYMVLRSGAAIAPFERNQRRQSQHQNTLHFGGGGGATRFTLHFGGGGGAQLNAYNNKYHVLYTVTDDDV
ncbi:hypothetical protein BGX33_003019 [Mortierella sp. NVP41]|nr:hypothetical protein BGX33_003019 [Mortierella sp. NVP41]